MEGVIGGGGGGGGSCMSAVSKEDSLPLSSEDSWCPHEPELELGLGLSLGRGGSGGGLGGGGLKVQVQGAPRGKYTRFLTARDFPASSAAPSSSSSSSSSTLSRGNGNGTAGTKRTADSVAAATSPVVGWPPVGLHRMNSLVNQAKSTATDGINSVPKTKSKYTVVDESNNGIVKRNDPVKENGHLRRSLFVKVNMDGIRIGRKVDLSAHNSYEALAQTLENMFFNSTTTINSIRSSGEEHEKMVKAARQSKLLDGSSEFVLTYEDKDRDWMLVGDVPWGMFLSSVKRLRIMRTSEANGLGYKK